MQNFWDYSVWGTVNLIAVLLLSLLVANVLKKRVKFLKNSLLPSSVLGGLILLVISTIYYAFTSAPLFNENYFGGNGLNELEVITYHCLALGFIASTLKTSDKKLTGQRAVEIFNTGVTTVSTYLLQGVIGLSVTLIIAFIVPNFFKAAGVLLPFGYGQGTGQALNYGMIYENDYGFVGGKNFGLTVAALGFLSASIGGVIHLNILKKKGKITVSEVNGDSETVDLSDANEINGNSDKLTTQIAFVLVTYALTYLITMLLGKLIPSMIATIYGFNFLFGVLTATLVKFILNKINGLAKETKSYQNNYLLTRISNFFFDIMVVAGIAAIRLELILNYWYVLLILGVLGLAVTYAYNYFVAKKLFPNYAEEQFLMTYGMLTGTASTGVILLREIDPEFKTPVQDNLIYQNFPAIVFGFPLMLLATLAPTKPELTLLLLALGFILMNVILFRSFIFKKKKSA